MLLPVIMLDAHQFRFAGRLGNMVPALDVTAEFPLRVPVNGADSCLLLKYSTLGLLAAPKGTVGRARTCASPTDMLAEREGTGAGCADGADSAASAGSAGGAVAGVVVTSDLDETALEALTGQSIRIKPRSAKFKSNGSYNGSLDGFSPFSICCMVWLSTA